MTDSLADEFSVIPVNGYAFSEAIIHDAPKLYPDFERSALARHIDQVSLADTHTIVNRSYSSRIWADAWLRDHGAIDPMLPAIHRDDDRGELKARLAAAYDALFPDIYEFLGLGAYRSLLAGGTYSPVTRMQALAKVYLHRPRLEEVAALRTPNERLRTLRLIEEHVPLRVVAAMLPTLVAWKKRGGGGSTERMLNMAVLLEHQGIPLEESARLLDRFSYLKVYELMERAGVPDEYLDAIDG